MNKSHPTIGSASPPPIPRAPAGRAPAGTSTTSPLRVPSPVRHPRHLPRHRPRNRAPPARRQDPQDVPGRQDLPHRPLQAALGQELP
ncbi:hypothetical protein BHE74_00021820 [Ensete ventricosum]|nr:hypothetical protein BHE74_00021820 [Ensete ventricosum]